MKPSGTAKYKEIDFHKKLRFKIWRKNEKCLSISNKKRISFGFQFKYRFIDNVIFIFITFGPLRTVK